MAVIGIDIGTTACKCAVLGNEGKKLAEASAEYGVTRGGGQASLDCTRLLSAVKDIIKNCAGSVREKIDAICVSSFGETFVPVNGKGEPLADAMLYTDRRGEKETEELQKHSGRFTAVAGVCPHQMYSLAKMMYIKRGQPELYRAAHKFLQIHDYIVFSLCGDAVTDYSMAARTMAFDIYKKRFSDELLEFADISFEKLPKPVPSGTIAEKIRPAVAAELGLDKDCVIVAGAHDQVCAALGAGVFEPGAGVDGMGTVECITPFFEKPFTDDGLYAMGYACVPYVLPDTYVTYAFIYTGGALSQWYRNNFLTHEINTYPDLFAHLSRQFKKPPTGIFILPHFAGAATPYMDADAAGAIVGLNLETDKYDLYKAVLEGATFEMMVNIDRLNVAGVAIKRLFAVGGGSRSDDFLQLKADMTGVPITRVLNAEGGINGAAMLAAVALGKYKTLQDAAKYFVSYDRVFEPDLKLTARYKELFEKYKRIYPRVKEIIK